MAPSDPVMQHLSTPVGGDCVGGALLVVVVVVDALKREISACRANSSWSLLCMAMAMDTSVVRSVIRSIVGCGVVFC